MSQTFDIGLDLDDVLMPWSTYAHEACEAAGITNGKTITRWSFHEDYGCTSDELWAVLNAAYLDGMLQRPPYGGALEEVLLLQSFGHRVHIVTARGFEGDVADTVRSETRYWVDRNFPTIDSLTFAKDKTTVHADYFLDDSIKNVAALRARGVEAYLRTQRHNRFDTILPRVDDLAEFVGIVLREVDVLVGGEN